MELRAQLDRAERIQKEYATWISERDQRLRQLGIDVGPNADPTDALKKSLKDTEDANSKFALLQEEGEKLALQIARLAEGTRKLEVEKELLAARAGLKKQ